VTLGSLDALIPNFLGVGYGCPKNPLGEACQSDWKNRCGDGVQAGESRIGKPCRARLFGPTIAQVNRRFLVLPMMRDTDGHAAKGPSSIV
jgi:hypothetical protein